MSLADVLRQDVTNGEVAGAGLALALVVALRLLLPEANRRLLRQPALFLIAHLIVLTVGRVFPGEGPAHRAVLVIALLLLLASIGRSSVLLVLDVAFGRRMARPLPKIIRDLTQGVVYVAVGLAALRMAGIDPGSILTTSALLTAVIGLSLQETLGNLFAGLAVQVQRPFDVGDWIQFDADTKHIGKVLEINWRATKVVTLDDVEIIVPNGTLGKAPIVNFTKPGPASRRSVFVTLPYGVPPRRAQKIIANALQGSLGVLADPAPSIVTNAFADSGVEYWVRFWTDQFHRRDGVDGAARDRIWYALAREGIPIASPQRVVHMHEVTEESLARETERQAAKRVKSLHQVDVLAVLGRQELERLAGATKVHLYANGETIVRKGDRTSELYVIRTGSVRVLVPKKGGKLEEVARLEAGKFFGETALMTGEPRNATVVAAEDSELLAISHEALEQTLDGHPQLAETMSRVLAERQAKLEEHAARSTEEQAKVVDEKTSQILQRIRSLFAL